MLNEKDLVTKYRETIYQETGTWIMPSVEINENPSDRAMQLVLSTNRNLETYGRTMSLSLLDTMVSLPESEIVKECQKLMKSVRESSQAEAFQNATVFYPDFPEQVMEMSEVEKYINQLAEYFNPDLRPEFEASERNPLLEDFNRNLKLIETDNYYLIHETMHDRMFSAASLSKPKMETLLNYMHDTNEWFSWVYEQAIPNRENKAAIAFDITKNSNLTSRAKDDMLHKLVTEATDVLRLAAELSNGKTHTVKSKAKVFVWNPKKGETRDNGHLEWRTKRNQETIKNKPGLAGKVYFKLSRSEARMMNSLLDKTHDLFTAVWLRPDLFKTFSKSVPRDTVYSRLQKAYDNLYSGQKVNEIGVPIVSPYAVVQKALDAVRSGADDALALTEKAAHDFPGVFNRNFIQFAVAGIKHDQLQAICDIYTANAYETPIREQLKLYNLVDLYEKGLPYRAIHVAKLGRFVKEESTYHFAEDQAKMIKKGIIDSVSKQLQNHDNLGRVYIDPNVVDMLLPENGERSSSKGSSLTSGSIMKGDKNCNIIRQFIGWQNQNREHIDIDTSAAFYDKDLNLITECAYYDQKAYVQKDDKSRDLVAIHGGDITSAPVFSAEYMDIDKQKCREAGIKYMVLSVNSYSNVPYNKLDVVKFGFMQRQGSLDPNVWHDKWNEFNGQIFEPSTVEALIDLNSESTATVPLIYDVEKDEFIWVDKPLERERGLQNIANVAYMNATEALIHRYTNNYTPSLGDLVAAYVYAGKATEVSEPTEADMIFTMKPELYTENNEMPLQPDAKVVSTNDFDYIASELMAAGKKEPDLEHIAGDMSISGPRMDAIAGDIVTLGSNHEALASREPFVVNQAHYGSLDPRVLDMNVSEFRQDANDTGFYPEENVEPDDIGDIVD